MCGIAGILRARGPAGLELEAIAERMGEELAHRGPDSAGTWADASAGVALAHRRLAILDLSPNGAQPMRSASGRYVTTFNGEIYNHADLRLELARRGHAFRGHGDTEVLLAAVEAWGIRGALERANGMFALAVWDGRERLLHLARDRIGEKPLYYGWWRGAFLFGSELKALRAFPGCDPPIDRDALALYMRHGYIAAPYSIYRGFSKLLPGGLLTVSAREEEASLARYWSHVEAARRGAAAPFAGTDAEAVEQVEALLRDAVRIRMHADVPLGAFLSGGIDSSTVVALMQSQSARRVKTFTIGFHEDAFDEAEHARRVARHLGTDHTELYLDASDALQLVPSLPATYDEPFADDSQLPTILVSRLARREVTVSLSGDAGDELFWGYRVYRYADGVRRSLRWIPRAARRAGGRALLAVPLPAWKAVLDRIERVVPGRMKGRRGLALRLRTMAEILRSGGSDAQLYRTLVSRWKQPTGLVRGAQEPPTPFTDARASPELAGFDDWMMFVDAVTYLPDDILVKVDRATMSVGLEGRVPLLDHRLVELAWRLPLALKRRGGESKWVLRQILYRHVPRALVDRPKMGFGVPIGGWLRGPLRAWAEDLLDERSLERDGYLDPAPVREKLADHLSSRRDLSADLWSVLMFQAWLREWSGPMRPRPRPRAWEPSASAAT